jgi:hypothetical protein
MYRRGPDSFIWTLHQKIFWRYTEESNQTRPCNSKMTVRCKIHKKWKDIKILQFCKIAKSKLELWLNRLYQESTVFDVCIKPIHTEAQNSRTKFEKPMCLMFPCTENDTNTWHTFHIQPESITLIFKYAATSKKNVCINSVTMNLKIAQFSLHTIEKWSSVQN